MANYNWKSTYLDTFIPELPVLMNNNFAATQIYMDIFFDPSRGVIIAPINTPGNIRGARVEGVTGVFDNLVVRNQYTNLYENTTTIDSDYYNTYIGADASTRDASTGGDLTENGEFRYIDVNSPYYKIANDASIAFIISQMGQELELLFDVSTSVGTSPFVIMLNPSTDSGGVEILTITVADSSATWIKLIAVEYDASWGTSWTIKQYGGTYTKSEI